MSRFRKNKVKLQHHLLEGLEDYLEIICKWNCVDGIIPGQITRKNKGKGTKGLFLKYPTNSGYKLLYKCGTSVQEVFIICSDKELFEKEFKKNFPKSEDL